MNKFSVILPITVALLAYYAFIILCLIAKAYVLEELIKNKANKGVAIKNLGREISQGISGG